MVLKQRYASICFKFDSKAYILMYKSKTSKFQAFVASFFDVRENILKTAKALVEDTKMLVSGAASGQDKLAQAAQSSAKTITHLTDVVKLGAASIGSDDPETQV